MEHEVRHKLYARIIPKPAMSISGAEHPEIDERLGEG